MTFVISALRTRESQDKNKRLINGLDLIIVLILHCSLHPHVHMLWPYHRWSTFLLPLTLDLTM